MKRILISLAILALSLPLIACSSSASEGPITQTSDPVPTLASIEIYGKVATNFTQHISFKYGFLVEEVLVQSGEQLKAGQPLAVVDLSAQTDELALLELQIKHLEARLSSGNTNYQQALQSVKSAELRESQAKEHLATQEALFNAKTISKQDYEHSKNAHIIAKQDVIVAQANAKGTLQADSQSVTQTALELERIKTQYEQLKAFIDSPVFFENHLVNPLATSIVSTVNMRNGMYTVPQESLIALSDVNSLVIDATISEEYLKEIVLGKPVTIKPLMSPDTTFKGKITFISAKAEQIGSETMIPLKITLDEKTELLPNLNVDITILIGE